MRPTMPKHTTAAAIQKRRIAVIAVIAAIALALTVYFSVFCRVKLVTIENNERLSDPLILSELNIMPRRHLFSISKTKLEDKIRAISPYVKDVHMERKLPSEIVITLEEYGADFYIVKDDICYIVSDTLFVLEEIPLEELDTKATAFLALPEINDEKNRAGISNFGIGKTIRFADTENNTYIPSLMKTFAEYALSDRITALHVDERANITAEIDGKYLLKLGNSKGLKEKLALCEASIDYLTENMAGVKGTLHAWTTEKVTFEITGVAESP